MEREHETAAPAPAPVVAAPQAAGGGPPLLTALTPARILALQRTVGNRAVTALLSRQDADPEPTPVAGAADFGVSGGVPVATGTTTASKVGEQVVAKAPMVKLDGEAWLKKGKKLGSSAYIGVVQNLVHSDRATVYRHGGDPNGEILGEYHRAMSNKRDAASDPNSEGPGKKAEPQTFAPFYWQPGDISDTNVEGSPAKASRLGTPHDQPEFPAPVSHGPGRLTEFKGHDTFKMGLAVKKDTAVWMLTGTQWSVSWDVAVDASMNGAGKAVETKAIQDLLKDGPNVSLTDWSLDEKAGSPFEGFSTTAEAMKRTPSQLLNWLFAAKEHDPTSYKHICEALDAKAPDLNVAIACDTTDATFGKDTLSASVKRNGALVKSVGNVQLNNGDAHTVKVAWSEAVGSAAGLTPGTAIGVEIYVGGESLFASRTLGFPFNGSGDLTPGTGKYKVTLSVG